MKGVELPINTLVIVAIAVIVLLALVAMYFTGFNPFTSTVGLEGIRGEACRQMAQLKQCKADPEDIPTEGFDSDQDGKIGGTELTRGWDWKKSDCGSTPGFTTNDDGDNLASLCHCYYGIDEEGPCKTLCGCPGY
jgi:hypothetical protein